MPNIGIFFRYKNSVDVFVEDNNDEEFYLVLLNKVFEKTGHKINKLLTLGSKTNVLAACAADQQKREAKRIYLIDGDLDLVSNKSYELKFLYQLDKYCIENFLIQEDPIIEILHDLLVYDKTRIKNQLGFENWMKSISKPLIDLFLHYSLAKELCPTEKTVSLGVGNLCKEVKKVSVLDESKCNDRIEDLKSKILKVISEEDYNDRIYHLRTKWAYNIDTLLKIVSGKDYLLPLLNFRFSKFKGARISRNSFRIRLAKLIDVVELEPIKYKIG